MLRTPVRPARFICVVYAAADKLVTGAGPVGGRMGVSCMKVLLASAQAIDALNDRFAGIANGALRAVRPLAPAALRRPSTGSE